MLRLRVRRALSLTCSGCWLSRASFCNCACCACISCSRSCSCTMASGRRRTTLSMLSQSTANARMTPARSSLGSSKTPRSSLGARSSRFSTGSRRSSVFGNNKMQEPRPIGDKSYTQENIRSLIHFLTTHQYDREISPKILSTPARKDFVSILCFLFRHIYPNFEFANTWDEDVPILFEAIGLVPAAHSLFHCPSKLRRLMG